VPGGSHDQHGGREERGGMHGPLRSQSSTVEDSASVGTCRPTAREFIVLARRVVHARHLDVSGRGPHTIATIFWVNQSLPTLPVHAGCYLFEAFRNRITARLHFCLHTGLRLAPRHCCDRPRVPPREGARCTHMYQRVCFKPERDVEFVRSAATTVPLAFAGRTEPMQRRQCVWFHTVRSRCAAVMKAGCNVASEPMLP
jgi:hypothetical protein